METLFGPLSLPPLLDRVIDSYIHIQYMYIPCCLTSSMKKLSVSAGKRGGSSGSRHGSGKSSILVVVAIFGAGPFGFA